MEQVKIVGMGVGRGGGWSWCFSCVCSICACLVLSVSSSSWCLEEAAVCGCGTPWDFLLSFFSTDCSKEIRLLWFVQSVGSISVFVLPMYFFVN